MSTDKRRAIRRGFCLCIVAFGLTSNTFATKPIPPYLPSTLDTIHVDWVTCRATLRLEIRPDRPCDSAVIDFLSISQAHVVGDSRMVFSLAGQDRIETIFDVEFACHDTSAIYGLIQAYLPRTDTEGAIGGGFGMFFDTRVDPPVASTTPPWQVPIDLGTPPPRVARKATRPDEWAPPEGSRHQMHSDHELTMEELHEREKTPLDPAYFYHEEIAGGKVWRRKGGEFTFTEVPNSSETASQYLRMFAEKEARMLERTKEKKSDKSMGISFDSLSVLERTALDRVDRETITVEGRTYGRVRGDKEFIEAIPEGPYNHRAFVLDLSDSENYDFAESVVDSLFAMKKLKFYWAWLDKDKYERLKAAGISIEPYTAPIITATPKK